MKFCSKCGHELKQLEDDWFNHRYECTSCGEKYTKRQEWLDAVGAAGTILSIGKIS